MEETVTAIYENGVLRPLAPLNLAEHTRVRIDIRPEPNIDELPPEERRQALHAILVASGVVAPNEEVPPTAHLLGDEEREELARRFAGGPPLSQIIIEEREGR